MGNGTLFEVVSGAMDLCTKLCSPLCDGTLLIIGALALHGYGT